MTAQQRMAITREADTAIKLIKAGLAAVQRLSGANDFFHLPILLLSNGLERLMKAVLCLHHLQTEGSFPARGAFRHGSKGHDLAPLLKQILTKCFHDEYLQIPAADADRDYLANDPLLQNTLQILSDFGVGGRYCELNVVLGDPGGRTCPDAAWAEMESELLKREDDWVSAVTDPGRVGETHRRANERLVACVEKCVRALARLFTLGPLGQEGKRHTGIIGEFLCVRDDQLGTRRYSPLGDTE